MLTKTGIGLIFVGILGIIGAVFLIRAFTSYSGTARILMIIGAIILAGIVINWLIFFLKSAQK